MTWKLDEGRPIYGQLVDEIKLRIMTGVYPAGSRMQSVRDLAGEAGVNPNTMQRALAELERQDLVRSRRTSGRFVTEDEERIGMMRRQAAEKITADFLQRMYALGLSGEDIVALIYAQGSSGRELPSGDRRTDEAVRSIEAGKTLQSPGNLEADAVGTEAAAGKAEAEAAGTEAAARKAETDAVGAEAAGKAEMDAVGAGSSRES